MKTRILIALISAMALAPVALTSTPTVQDETLSRKEQETLVRDYMALSGKTRADRDQQALILEQLEVVPWPDKSTLKRWRKTMAKNHSKGNKLKKKSGWHWYWEKEKRGKYYIGGNTKRPRGLIDEAMRTWDIDPQHVYLGGHSMGGYGTCVLGAHHADCFASLCISAGAPTPVTVPSGKYEGIMYGVAPNLINMPMCVYQSLDDQNVPPAANPIAVKVIEESRETWGGLRGLRVLGGRRPRAWNAQRRRPRLARKNRHL